MATGLESRGYDWNFISTEPRPWQTYYSKDKKTGEVIKHRLPADAYSLNLYLNKGFKLNPEELGVTGYVCGECGKSFKNKIALTGHSRTHKSKKGG